MLSVKLLLTAFVAIFVCADAAFEISDLEILLANSSECGECITDLQILEADNADLLVVKTYNTTDKTLVNQTVVADPSQETINFVNTHNELTFDDFQVTQDE
ncbi:uncharacterized protein SCDLUD_001816 [Saccharomycodes ludwigii]|uniref:uncharacterized protein n=1 Tax=Saccharomycodes ludwigii TaxID=36035 RepID=UPI001E887687|nr:hypothetical protein SCDLUD_001816 [Saccharomycodes ludwigii]KAH3902027.1 hypothetical protein SCDLUD_001816 [Saccharomycodes ludwigii]